MSKDIEEYLKKTLESLEANINITLFINEELVKGMQKDQKRLKMVYKLLCKKS